MLKLSSAPYPSTSVTRSAPGTWHLLTGEYPPDRGGVAHYTALLAEGLAAHDCEVHVWRPGRDASEHRPENAKIHVHDVPDFVWGSGLRTLDAALAEFPQPATILVQYVPNAMGLRGMNVPFCLWLWRRSRRGDDVRVMFHEPYFYFTKQRPWRNLLAVVQRGMAGILMAASRHVYVSTPAWNDYLRPYRLRRTAPFTWLPIPSTIARCQQPDAIQAIRQRLGQEQQRQIVGHFGTYGETTVLEEIFLRLLDEQPQVVLHLLGSRGQDFAEQLARLRPQSRERIVATGYLNEQDTSLHLQSCDLLLQPYPDGATSRRTSLMACLANGVATVTNRGALSEPLWDTSELALAGDYDPRAIVELTINLLADSGRRAEVAERGREFYAKHFDLPRTLEPLLRDSCEGYMRPPAAPVEIQP